MSSRPKMTMKSNGEDGFDIFLDEVKVGVVTQKMKGKGIYKLEDVLGGCRTTLAADPGSAAEYLVEDLYDVAKIADLALKWGKNRP